MIIDIFNEIPWQSFQNLEFIKKLPLNEQKKKYDEYISELSLAKDYQLNYQVKGPYPLTSPSAPPACAEGMDVIFLLDFSGSMDDIIASLKTEIADIVQTIITESNNDYRLGMILFDEYETAITVNYTNVSRYTSLPADRKRRIEGDGSSQGSIYMYITGLVEMAANNQLDFTAALNDLDTPNFPMQQGTGAPEPGDVGFEYLLGGNNILSSPDQPDPLPNPLPGPMVGAFRSGVTKIVILISDALPGGGNETYDSTTITSLTTSKDTCVSEAIQVFYFDVSDPSAARPANQGYRILSDNTQGLFAQSSTADATEIKTGIQDICTNNA